VDQQELQRKLLELAGQLGPEQTAHTMRALSADFRRLKLHRGLLKQRTFDVYASTLDKIDEAYGDLDIRGTDWLALAGDRIALDGQAAWRVLQMLRSLLVHAQRIGWRHAPHGLASALKRCAYKDRECAYDEQQLGRLLWALDDLDRSSPRKVSSREVIRGCVYTGCRVSEIASLRVEDLGDGFIRLRDSKTGARRVPVCEQAVQLFRRQQERDGWLFPGRCKGSVSTHAVWEAFLEARDHAGLDKDGVVHSLRHSFASVAARNGVPEAAVQRVLGHKTAVMTRRYTHANDRDGRHACLAVASAIDNAKAGGVR
jgi:integrase